MYSNVFLLSILCVLTTAPLSLSVSEGCHTRLTHLHVQQQCKQKRLRHNFTQGQLQSMVSAKHKHVCMRPFTFISVYGYIYIYIYIHIHAVGSAWPHKPTYLPALGHSRFTSLLSGRSPKSRRRCKQEAEPAHSTHKQTKTTRASFHRWPNPGQGLLEEAKCVVVHMYAHTCVYIYIYIYVYTYPCCWPLGQATKPVNQNK